MEGRRGNDEAKNNLADNTSQSNPFLAPPRYLRGSQEESPVKRSATKKAPGSKTVRCLL